MSTISRLLVRPAGKEDVDVLVNFSRAMALETEGRHLDEDRLRRGTLAVFDSAVRGFYLVAESIEKKTVVGQLLITYEWSDWRNATFWWIQSVYVHPDWRRQGVYRQMYESVVKMARDRSDVCGLRLYVEENNRVAQSVYEAMTLHRTTYEIWEVDFVL
jgi:GNAT superfamily N-acetyltransferase